MNEKVLRQDPKVRNWLRNSGNPYASLSLFDEADDAPADEMSRKRAYFRRLQNPHAHGPIFGEPAADYDQPELNFFLRPADSGGGASKRKFQETCRRILLQYVPPSEGRVLRPHYRDFILRNEDSSPANRLRIINELQKYDLSTDTTAFQPHFNRGNEVFTERKLRQIEEGR